MSAEHSDKSYFKTYCLLIVLFIVSITGPELGIPAVTMITAFGIAFVKAYYVLTRFMHVNVEKKIVTYLMVSMILASLVFIAGIAADVMTPGGNNWIRL